MGYIRHHAIVVTSHDGSLIIQANVQASFLFGNMVSDIIESPYNSYKSFFIAPDGSKEGWPESEEGDNNRRKFIEWINSKAFDDGSSSINYAELFYGDEEGEAKIESHN